MPAPVASHALQALICPPQGGDGVTKLRMQIRRWRGGRCEWETQCQNKHYESEQTYDATLHEISPPDSN
jgi:hypothetical protein